MIALSASINHSAVRTDLLSLFSLISVATGNPFCPSMCHIPSVTNATGCSEFNASSTWTAFTSATWRSWTSPQDGLSYSRCVANGIFDVTSCHQSGEGWWWPSHLYTPGQQNSSASCGSRCSLYFDTYTMDQDTCESTHYCTSPCSATPDIFGGCANETQCLAQGVCSDWDGCLLPYKNVTDTCNENVCDLFVELYAEDVALS